MKKQNFLIFGTAFFATLFVLFGAILVYQCRDGKKSAKVFADVAGLVQETPESGSPEGSASEIVQTVRARLCAEQRFRGLALG